MPELPEVEVASRQLRAWWGPHRTEGVQIPKTRVLRGQAPAAFAALAGRRLLAVERLGKWMLLSFEDGLGLLSHLGMTGKWLRRPASAPAAAHARATFLLEGGEALDYRDPRLFGQLTVGPVEELRRLPTLAALGPDPLPGVDEARLLERLRATRRSIKEALMDQALLAGLGNIQVAESLWRARLHPERAAGSLSEAEAAGLARAIEASLRETLAAEDSAEPIAYVEEGGANPFAVYGREGEACRVCGGRIGRIVQGGRSTYFCEGCQGKAEGEGKARAKGKAKAKGKAQAKGKAKAKGQAQAKEKAKGRARAQATARGKAAGRSRLGRKGPSPRARAGRAGSKKH